MSTRVWKKMTDWSHGPEGLDGYNGRYRKIRELLLLPVCVGVLWAVLPRV